MDVALWTAGPAWRVFAYRQGQGPMRHDAPRSFRFGRIEASAVAKPAGGWVCRQALGLAGGAEHLHVMGNDILDRRLYLTADAVLDRPAKVVV